MSDMTDTYSLGKVLYWLFSDGRVFSREVHRDVRWDLKGRNQDTLLGWTNIYFEHINRLLDLMVVVDPEKRRSVSNIRILARHAKRLVSEQFTPIAPGLGQPCTYCGVGRYTIRAQGADTSVSNFGFSLVGAPNWRILTCSECGHVQAFRVDLANRKEWCEGGAT